MMVRWPAVARMAIKMAFGKILRLIIIGFTKPMRTTPTAALQMVPSLPSVDFMVLKDI